ncbi:hypothetical protein CYLTODRAFT_454195 [Cylindrobasidium torrendii FP15055 ss-10]|uniref:NAD(P)-binding protein n=1 Tax=Cylindrobasidium torrendii FP15055 ss-10 TaxID=1314674 RepID=A0A0D7BC84_9AGAR|nr:hypothetical protein CYLTODRAFT_454195 [Cylindrobasidium torrendii FP15055 ss-10]
MSKHRSIFPSVCCTCWPRLQLADVSSTSPQLVAALPTPKVHQPAYQASKAAVDHLTHILASKFREHGVRVNTIAPGYFELAMNNPKNPNSMISKAKVLVPLKHGGNGTDIGGTASAVACKSCRQLCGRTDYRCRRRENLGVK